MTDGEETRVLAFQFYSRSSVLVVFVCLFAAVGLSIL